MSFTRQYARKIKNWDLDWQDPAQSHVVTEPYARKISAILKAYRKEITERVRMVIQDQAATPATVKIAVDQARAELQAGLTETIRPFLEAAVEQGTTFADLLLTARPVPQGAGPYLHMVSVDAGFVGPIDWRVVDALLPRNLSVLEGITEDVNKTIIRTLTDGMMAGEGSYALADRLKEGVEGFDWHRAETMARTEAMEALNRGTDIRFAQAGVKEVKWLSAGDDGRTCDECLELHGQIFTLEDVPDMPHPNCRCTHLPVIPGIDDTEIPQEVIQEEIILPTADPKGYLIAPGDKYDLYDVTNLSYPTTAQAQEAHHIYTANGYKVMSKYLRTGTATAGEIHTPDQIVQLTKALNEAIAQVNPMEKGVTLYRGAGANTGQSLINSPIGSIISDKGFQSFSVQPQTAQSFTHVTEGGKRVIIQAITSGKERGISGMIAESEVIIQPGTAWKIIAKNIVKGGSVYSEDIMIVTVAGV